MKKITRGFFKTWDITVEIIYQLLKFALSFEGVMIIGIVLITTLMVGLVSPLQYWPTALRWSMGFLSLMGLALLAGLLTLIVFGIITLCDSLRKWAYS